MFILVVDRPAGPLLSAVQGFLDDAETSSPGRVDRVADVANLTDALSRRRYDALVVAADGPLRVERALRNAHVSQPAVSRIAVVSDQPADALAAVAHAVVDVSDGWAPLAAALAVATDNGPELPAPLIDVVGGIASLPSVADVLEELRTVFDDEAAGALDVARVVERDPGLTAKVLHLANAGFVRRTVDVQDVEQAAALLGVRTLRQVVLSSAAFAAAEDLGADAGLVELAQRHGLVASRACRRSEAVPAVAATGALLMDVGLPLMSLAWPEEHWAAREACRGTGLRLVDEERRRFGATHADAGVALAKRWSLPVEVVEMIGGHHFIPRSQERGDRELGFMVHFAAQHGDADAVDPFEPDLTDRVPDWLLPHDQHSAESRDGHPTAV